VPEQSDQVSRRRLRLERGGTHGGAGKLGLGLAPALRVLEGRGQRFATAGGPSGSGRQQGDGERQGQDQAPHKGRP
jgi:hypothetical protein